MSEHPHSALGPPASESTRILLVESSPRDARRVTDLLATLEPAPQLEVTRATGLAEALDALVVGSFDVALTELSLPDGVGLDVIDQLLAREPGLSLVVLSGLVADGLPEAARERGAHEFLPKGKLDADTLAAALRHALKAGHMETALREERKQLEIALDAAQAGAWVLRVDGGSMRRDARASTLLGLEARELTFTSHTFLENVYEADQGCVRVAWEHSIRTGDDLEVEYRTVAGHGERFVTDRGRVVAHHGGTPSLIAGISWDSTERRRAEDATRIAHKEESLSTLAGGVAHDFNNLLVAILGHCAMAEHLSAPDEGAAEHLRHAVTAAERAAGLARQMLAYSGRGQLEVKPVDVNALIRESQALLAAAVDHRVVLEVQAGAALPPVLADETQVQQVIMNLILNAAESCMKVDGGGRILISTSMVSLSPADATAFSEFTRTSLAAGDFVRLRVRDDGAGVSEGARARMFDPFYSTKGTGRGLGLSAVLGIVRGHGGGIRVRDGLGTGAEFEVLLPASTLEHAASPSHPASPEPASQGLEGIRVLVIDDDDLVRTTCESMLISLGATCVLAEDGREGVAMFLKYQRDIDVVLLDMTMPGLSGDEVLRAIRRIREATPIAIASGYAEREVLGQFGADAPDVFLQKPFRVEALGQALRSVVGQPNHLPS